ncbi:MAG TPA: NUDIX hydrolase, partial [Marmoricola sp.]|nr:NUDIX hydrolase [Marmoricola sp.]
MSAEAHEITPGVWRLAWSEETQEAGVGEAIKAVRSSIGVAFRGGAKRIETYLDPNDPVAHRIASLCGLLKEGVARGIEGGVDRAVYARLQNDPSIGDEGGFRRILNAFLPRKRAIGQMLIRDTEGRVLLCELTYKSDHDLPGGVVEVSESPREATAREVTEELGLEIPAGDLILTDWLPPWGGWDDAVCLVFDGGVHEAAILDQMVKQPREIKHARF